MTKPFSSGVLMTLSTIFVLHPMMYGAVLTVLTVPWDPTNPLSPHTTYPINPSAEVKIVLGATVPSAVGSADSYTVTWSFGDGSSNVTFPLTNPYDISTTHQYPASAGTGTAWTATVTVMDTNTGATGTANYYVTQAKNVLSSRVNVAIDSGLWYMHQTMWRSSTVVGGNTVQWGGWDTQIHPCNLVNGQAYDCASYGVVNAENVQAFEVSGHSATGPATDPYADDVARGLARMFASLASQPNNNQKYLYDPAAVNYGCSTGYPDTNGNCPAGATKIFYNPGATSCTSPPCNFIFDGNSNSQMIFSNDGSGETIYTTGPFMDALVGTGTPNATAPTGVAGVQGQTYKNIVQDMLDWYSSCQYGNDVDPGNPAFPGQTRGAGNSASGGGWLYGCQQGDDNSTSQWAAIGLIGASRGFGIPVPPAVKDFNNVWVTNAQDVQHPTPTGPDPFLIGDDFGSFGYRGSLYYSNAWGPFATTPSAMVQMSLDGIGRTDNTVFGAGSNAPDQRFNNAETFYADNFCNNPGNGANYAPRAYTYGMFSFTKAMLLHDPGGVLNPIQYLRTQTPNVFTGNPNVPPNSIDWYAAQSAANGGQDACDGVAQTLVGLQQSDGHWTGNDYYYLQMPFETAWSIIMLKKTVFVSCVNNLAGRGSASGPLTNLSWSAQTNATGYAVLRSSQNGGPYSQVGTTNLTSYRDTNSGLVDGNTYYYVVQPLQGTTEVCQSNQATILVP